MHRLKFAIARCLVIVWAVVLFIPPEFVQAQSMPILPMPKHFSRIVEQVQLKKILKNFSAATVSIHSEQMNPNLILHKLEVLSEALIRQNIKGLAAQKPDKFMSEYFFSIGLELNAWMEGKEKFFLDLFKIKGPWVFMFSVMSPNSMHEYVQDLDLPCAVGGIVGAQKIKVNMLMEINGNDVFVETQGANKLWITFRINEKNVVSVVKD